MPSSAVNAPASKASPRRFNGRRHSLKCHICNHPDRAAIEFDFLNWRNPGDLVKSYHFRGLSTIYRHAHATGLLAKRRLNLRFAMERIVERVNEVPVTANAVIRAARAIARINDEGQWVDPPSHLVIHHAHSVRSPELESQPKDGSCSGRSGVARPGKTVDVRSRPSPIFESALLDEPSESAIGELPKIPGEAGRAAPEEVILTITPEFYKCREERQRAIEADRQAHAAKNHAAIDNPVASGNGIPESESFVGRGFNRDMNAGSSSSSLLPQAAVENSAQFASRSSDRDASSALPHRAGFENNVADNKEKVASSSSALPPARRGWEASPDKPATASPEQGRGARQSPRAAGPPLGSSGSADPPFPFTQESRRRWNPRRRF